jgi:hypothetical protein
MDTAHPAIFSNVIGIRIVLLQQTAHIVAQVVGDGVVVKLVSLPFNLHGRHFYNRMRLGIA